MEINYIILVHKNPEQVKRLITRLQTDSVFFYLHIDKNCKIKPFLDILGNLKNVTILRNEKRKAGTWGDVGIVKGTLNAIEQILLDNRKGTCFLISGMDYPLISANMIRDFLAQNPSSHFIDIFSLPNNRWQENGMDRIKKYKINYSLKRYHFFVLPTIFDKDFYKLNTFHKIKFLIGKGKVAEVLNLFKKRKIPYSIEPFGGTQWWGLPVNTLKHLMDFLNEHPKYLDFYKFSLLPDEMFFQSAIKALPKSLNIDIKPSLTYTNWNPERGAVPVTFRAGDFDELKNARDKFLFARKFDHNLDNQILNKIDSELLE